MCEFACLSVLHDGYFVRLGRVQCLEQLRSFSTVETFQNQAQVAHAAGDHAPVLQVLLASIHIQCVE